MLGSQLLMQTATRSQILHILCQLPSAQSVSGHSSASTQLDCSKSAIYGVLVFPRLECLGNKGVMAMVHSHQCSRSMPCHSLMAASFSSKVFHGKVPSFPGHLTNPDLPESRESNCTTQSQHCQPLDSKRFFQPKMSQLRKAHSLCLLDNRDPHAKELFCGDSLSAHSVAICLLPQCLKPFCLPVQISHYSRHSSRSPQRNELRGQDSSSMGNSKPPGVKALSNCGPSPSLPE